MTKQEYMGSVNRLYEMVLEGTITAEQRDKALVLLEAKAATPNLEEIEKQFEDLEKAFPEAEKELKEALKKIKETSTEEEDADEDEEEPTKEEMKESVQLVRALKNILKK